MNTRQVREALFHLENQEMTVRDLRSLLFMVEDQDKELEIGFAMWKAIEAVYKVGGPFPIVEDEPVSPAPVSEHPDYCERCGEKLDSSKAVWLELDNDTNLFHEGEIPEGHTSQGGFAFGRSCAKTVIRNGGKLDRYNKPKRSR